MRALGPGGGAPAERCELCGRDRPLTFHHLIPRALHRRKRVQRRFSKEELVTGVDLCADCHGAVHRFCTHQELAERFHTLEALRAHPEVGKFVAWVATRGGRHQTRAALRPPKRQS